MGTPAKQLIDQFVRGSSRMEYSSASLSWTKLLLEQHLFPPGQCSEGELGGSLLCLWNNKSEVRCDHLDAHNNFVPKLVPPDVFSLYTEGPLAPVRLCAPAYGLLCVFDTAPLTELLEEIRHEGNVFSLADGVVLKDKRCFTDPELKWIIERLGDEARHGGPNGRLYADEYIQLFFEQILLLFSTRRDDKWVRYKLDPVTFRHLCEQIRSTPGDQLSLAHLAAQSGYSERQFLRAFRAKTGRTPYQYILDLRIEKARRLMLKPNLSLIDIALECGFANHGHFTRAFGQRIGMRPSEFRKNLY